MAEKKKTEDATKKVKIKAEATAAVDGGAGTKATEEDIFQGFAKLSYIKQIPYA